MNSRTPVSLTPEALFRYRIVSAVKARLMTGHPLADAVRAITTETHFDAKGEQRHVTSRTLYRWMAAFGQHDIQGLEPAVRDPLQGSRVLVPALLDYLEAEHLADREASIPELLERARLKGLIRLNEKIQRSTVWKTFQRLGLKTARHIRPKYTDMRRFEYTHRMQMVLVDGKHFRAGPTSVRRVAIYFIDDATRYGLSVVIGASEHTELFLQGLSSLLRQYGLMDALFSDHGSAFTSDDATRVLVQLRIAAITGQVGHPEGRGKIERFNQSAGRRVLNSYRGAVEVDPALSALTLRVRHDLERYNNTAHESLGGDTPAERWQACTRVLRPVESEGWLTECFTLTDPRRVSKDNIIRFEGGLLEVPQGHAGENLNVYRRVLEPDHLSILHHGRRVKLHPADLQLNARDHRAERTPELPSEPVPHKSASTLDFDRQFGPLLNAEGGFEDPTSDHTDTLE